MLLVWRKVGHNGVRAGMRQESEPRNIVRHARDNMLIAEGVNREIINKKSAGDGRQTVDRALAWTSYYTLLFVALAVFMPYETAMAMERTVDIADKVGGVMGFTNGWGIHIRGTLD